MEKTRTVSVAFAKSIIFLSLIDPAGWTIAETPDCTSFSIPSTKGKKASDAATTFFYYQSLLFFSFY